MNPKYNPGDIIYSPGGSFPYKILGAICPLFNKGNWSLWDGEGNQLVSDIASQNYENYAVTHLNSVTISDYIIFTNVRQRAKLNPNQRHNWYFANKKEKRNEQCS